MQRHKLLRFIIAFGFLVAGGASLAQAAVKIGVLTDMSGPNADIGGKGSVLAVEMAIKDFGGKVLGQPITLLTADMESKAGLSASIARRWYSRDKVNVIVDINNSAAAIEVNHLAEQYKRIDIVTQAAVASLTRQYCTPYSIHYGWDTYSSAAAITPTLVGEGRKTWYFITVNYAFGHNVQGIMGNMVRQRGGRVLGSVFFPEGTSNFASYLLDAEASGAKTIAFIASGQDLQNLLKQASEFDLRRGGRHLVAPFTTIPDIHAVGVSIAHGLVFSAPFYWNQTPAARAWSERFFSKMHRMPTAVEAADYSAVLHYLQAVKAAGTLDSLAVIGKMKELPIDDMYARGRIRPDGLLLHNILVVKVRSKVGRAGPWDYYRITKTIPGTEAFEPVDPALCKFVSPSARH